jgi:protease-4
MTKRRNPIAEMWTGFWKLITWLRMATFNLLFLLILFVVLGTVFAPKHLPVPQEGPLLLTPSGFLVDQKAYKSPTMLLMEPSDEMPAETVVRDLVNAIQVAATDPNVSALILDLSHLMGGALSKLEEVGQALQIFKASGKPIIAYGDNYTQSQYYLASYADEIYLNDMGAVLVTGFGLYRHYMEEGLDKLDVNVHVFRVGEFKDFIEPFIRNEMSQASRQHNMRWLHELWGVYTSRIESLRELPKGAIDDFVNNLDIHMARADGNSARMALEHGFVDVITSRVAVHEMLMERFGTNHFGDSFKAIPHDQYLARIQTAHPIKPERIGLIVASGSILEGEQPAGNIGGDTLSRLIRQAREDETIKALVVRVDSGGGSAMASEVIREELAAMRAEGTPVVISMGSVAASGGYWMSLPANQIWATPTTITGSIGVFGVFPTFERTLANLGVHVDGLATTDLAGADRVDLALPEKAARVAQASVESIYERFVNLVADAREIPPSDVHELAQGKVWTGATAEELGLVDRLGYLQDAIAAAAELAALTDYAVQPIEPELSPAEQFLRAIRGQAANVASLVQGQAFSHWLGGSSTHALVAEQTTLARFYRELHNALSPLVNAKRNGVYAQCVQCTGEI